MFGVCVAARLWGIKQTQLTAFLWLRTYSAARLKAVKTNLSRQIVKKKNPQRWHVFISDAPEMSNTLAGLIVHLFEESAKTCIISISYQLASVKSLLPIR